MATYLQQKDSYSTIEATGLIQERKSSSFKAKAVILGFLLIAFGAFVGQKASQAWAEPLKLTNNAEEEAPCNGPCYAAHSTPWIRKCVPDYAHGCNGCPECSEPACDGTKGTSYTTGGASCKNWVSWTDETQAGCGDGSAWTAGTRSTDSSCIACTGTTYSTGGAACASWTDATQDDCDIGFDWTAGTASTDSSCEAPCNGPCYAAHSTPWIRKCVPGYAHGCNGCPECSEPACDGTKETSYTTGGASCKNWVSWTDETQADCGDGSAWTAGTRSTDSSCIASETA